MTKLEALDTIRFFSEDFPLEALREIQANRENFISELLDSLDYAYHNSKELYDDDSDYFMHIYAMYLLAEFKEKQAFPLLVNLLRLPEDEIEFILGDGLTEGFSQLLFCTFDSENIQMLFDVIENQELNEWARLSAIGAYEQLTKEGFVTKAECSSYLRNLIYDKLPSNDSYVVFTGIEGCVINAQLTDMIPDVRFLYEADRVDSCVYGEYDDFIDWFFKKRHLEPSYIDDAISEMEQWACFKSNNNSAHNKSKANDIFYEMAESIKKEKMIEQKPQKVGRNEPCPCGSGKKFKKCCIDAQQNNTSPKRLEDILDLLDNYPKESPQFEQMYEKESIEIDMLVYKALHHRRVPIWIQRDMDVELIGKIEYLNDALTLFMDKCQREQITSFSAYDERYMIHYQSREWVLDLIQLIEEYGTDSLKDVKQTAESVLQRFS